MPHERQRMPQAKDRRGFRPLHNARAKLQFRHEALRH